MDAAPPPTLVATEAEARAALARFEGAGPVGFDTETAFDPHARAFRLALVQLARPGEALVIDALAVPAEVMRPLLESPAVRLVAHNALFDRTTLATAGVRPAAMVDTLRLAQAALDLPAYGLDDVVQALFGVALDKSLQKSNWRRRPLTPAQLAYAAADPWWSLRAYDALRSKLEAAGRWEDALERATLGVAPPPRDKPRRRMKPAPPAPPLTPAERDVLDRLKRWRVSYARAAGTQPYRVCPDRTLEELARSRPATLESLKSVYGLGDAKVARFGETLLAALRGDAAG